MDHTSKLPMISVLLAVRNESKYILQTLEALGAQDYSKELLEIIIIDGDSSDDTVQKARNYQNKFIHFKIINNPLILSASGWNQGIKIAQGDVISILSGHVLLEDTYYKKVAAHLTDQISGVGGRAFPRGSDIRGQQIAKAFSSKLGSGGATYIHGDKNTFAETISFGSYWKKDLLSINGFDENVVRGQDWDLNMRLRQKGYKLLFVPDIEVQYFVRGSLAALWKRQFYAGLWKFYINRKSKKHFLLRHLIPGVFAFVFIALFILSVFSPLARYMLGMLIALYISAVVFQNTSDRTKLNEYPIMFCIYFIIHFAYGVGLLLGMRKK